MTRVRLSVDVDPELRRRVKVVAAARDQSVKDWIEGVIREALVRELQGARGTRRARRRPEKIGRGSITISPAWAGSSPMIGRKGSWRKANL
ncbi:MAG TPA: hypothetical protein VFE21_08155 [Rubrobacteraceae bacterium]|nr:hypothetical protein [Rubrobacteraceae bacterium]